MTLDKNKLKEQEQNSAGIFTSISREDLRALLAELEAAEQVRDKAALAIEHERHEVIGTLRKAQAEVVAVRNAAKKNPWSKDHGLDDRLKQVDHALRYLAKGIAIRQTWHIPKKLVRLEMRAETAEERVRELTQEVEVARRGEAFASDSLFKQYQQSGECSRFTYSGWIGEQFRRLSVMETALRKYARIERVAPPDGECATDEQFMCSICSYEFTDEDHPVHAPDCPALSDQGGNNGA